MIILEYDVPTAGTRFSFVLKDGETSLTIPEFPSDMVTKDGRAILPETTENLEWVKAVLEAVIDARKADDKRRQTRLPVRDDR